MYKKGSLPDLGSILSQKAERLSQEKGIEILKIAIQASNEEQKQYFRAVSEAMNKFTKPALPGFDKVTWSNLRPATVERKGHGRKWYSHLNRAKGEVALRDYLKQEPVSSHFINSTGAMVKSTVQKKSFIIESGLEEKRTPFSDLDGTYGTNKTQEVKVELNEPKRPIFEPMKEYFMRHRIPKAINTALRAKGYKTRFGV